MQNGVTPSRESDFAGTGLARYGTVSVSPDRNVMAGSTQRWVFTYVAGPEGMKAGGELRMHVPYGFSAPKIYPGGWPPKIDHPNQGPDPISTGYVDVCIPGRAEQPEMFHVEHFSPKGWNSPWYAKRTVRFVLRGDPLGPGETIEIVFGSRRSGSPGATVPVFSQRIRFPFTFLPKGGDEIRLPSPLIEIVPGPPEFATIASPSIAAPGERIAVKGTLRDSYGNPTRDRVKLTLRIGDASFGFDSKEAQTRFGIAARAPAAIGLVRPEVEFDSPLIANAQGNPTVVETSPEMRLFWGDLHGHTGLADGLGTVQEYFTYARDLAHLDFASLGEHDFAFIEDRWEAAKKVASDFNDPGRFVTLYGYEWSGDHHVNVYYRNESGQLFSHLQPESDTVTKLLKLLPREGAMAIPHQHFGTNWNEFDAELIRLTEIYSEHGSSEFKGCDLCLPSSTVNDDAYVQVALGMGHRIGFIGSSDSHCGRPGYSSWIRSRRQHQSGLAACFAPDLARDSVWDALHSRRCYATSGERIFLRFWLNDSFMGDETECAKGEAVTIRIEVHGTAEIASVDLVRSGQSIRSWQSPGWDFGEEFRDTPSESSCYYVRVRQRDTHLAWSSPIWVDLLP